MKVLIAMLVAFGTTGCFYEQVIVCPPPGCSQEARVVDYSGMDGCGLVLELPNGTRLIPLRLTYVHAPTPEEDPIYHYELTAGETIYISYNIHEGVSACMAGDVVFITCIRPVMEK